MLHTDCPSKMVRTSRLCTKGYIYMYIVLQSADPNHLGGRGTAGSIIFFAFKGQPKEQILAF